MKTCPHCNEDPGEGSRCENCGGMVFRYATDDFTSSTTPVSDDATIPHTHEPPTVPPVVRPAEPFAIDPFVTPSPPGRVPSSAERMEGPRLSVPDARPPGTQDTSSKKGPSGCAIAAIIIVVLLLMGLAGLFLVGRTVIEEIGDSIEVIEESTEATEADQIDDTQQPGSSLSPVDIQWAEVTAGDCINLLDPVEEGDTTLVSALEKVDCFTVHDAEVFAVFDLGGDDWPGTEMVNVEGDSACFDRFEPYVGIDYLESYYFYEYYTPTATSWEAGDRAVACVIVDPGGILSEPVRGSGK